MRIELIHYVLLKSTFIVDDLRMVKQVIRYKMESEPNGKLTRLCWQSVHEFEAMNLGKLVD